SMRTALALAPILSLVVPISQAMSAFEVAQPHDLAPPSPIRAPVAAGEDRATVASPRRPTIPIARGFGERVPPAFAVRQIVPGGIRLTLADGVDPDAPVDWRGGRAWDRTLAEAAAPLGLRLVAVRGGWVLRP